jgi:hypothetical protein
LNGEADEDGAEKRDVIFREEYEEGGPNKAKMPKGQRVNISPMRKRRDK